MNIERFFGGRTVLGLRTKDRPARGVGAPTLSPPTREVPPPVQDQNISQALREALRDSGDVFQEPRKTKNNRLLTEVGLTVGALLVVAGGVVWGINKIRGDDEPTTPQTRSVDSVGPTSFTDNRLVPRTEVEAKKVKAEEIFDNTATSGVKSERNTTKMTRKEYQNIAPPVIDRENRREVPLEFNLPQDTVKATGRTTRKLTLEQGTSVNAMVYVKTPEGGIREVSYTKIANPGEVKGQYPIPIIFPNCKEFLGQKGEIQAGDIFPAPISGRVYYRSGAGGDKGSDYFIEGDYYDATGKKFMAFAQVHRLEATKPLAENIPNETNYATKDKKKVTDSYGKEREIETTTFSPLDKDKMPVVTVQQGENLFQFITKPPVKQFVNAENIKSQILVTTNYVGDVEKNRFGEIFGGENCIHPTLDNKAVVLIQ